MSYGTIGLKGLKDAYLSVHVHESSQRYLCFQWRIIHFPGPTIWAKYSSQGLHKAHKTRSCVPAEERYSNNRIPGRLSYPRLLHRRPSSVARFHHQLGEIHPGPHAVTDIPLHKLTDNVTQPHRKKKPEHTAQMSKDSLPPHFVSSRSGKLDRHIGGGSPRNLASPTPLQVFTNRHLSTITRH